ncbi:hypothetical protein SAMN05216410_2988 [Sanguibacter gelidistatuariae]|uniref:TrbL/VirB6 plasmid conjugal transfer protein n=1 Tax=Sanguibacter gelidistatuariae TaxID=1814289 RepID=A0A1G6T065_9MICO|nr:hypothetical protein [Sanguibacter gelidistatuariae]SDD22532.1 hypothetical protein SAMN05216410_2988 [Sanguibacter gelidistatuariae]
MRLPTFDPCIGPINLLCDAAGNLVGSATTAASDSILGGLGQAFIGAAAQIGELTLAALDSTTAIDLSVSWLRANIAVIATVTLPIVVGLFTVQVISSVLRREPGGLVRALTGVAKAFVGSAIALAATQLALTAVDEICNYIAASAGTSIGESAATFFTLTAIATANNPAMSLVLGSILLLGFFLLWGVLLFRKAALILIAVFAPIAFAGSAWDQTKVWTRRWLEIVAALVFCKVVIVVVFVVGASAFSGTGPQVPDGALIEAQSPGLAQGISNVLVGILLLSISIFTPWLTWRFVHWSGIEAAAVMQSSMAANPVSSMARKGGRVVMSAGQQVLLTKGMGGSAGKGGASASSAASGASAGAGESGKATAASPPISSPKPAASPAPKSPGQGTGR